MLLRVLQSAGTLEECAKNFANSWDTYVFLSCEYREIDVLPELSGRPFLSVFASEILLKIIGIGWLQYIASGWNIFDVASTAAAMCGALLLAARPSFTAVVILRPLR